ncbi:MAG: hypothetical protein H6779_03235 [Candidatus Nomurabacteria bacterium]|nr:hypothetical protein [Candidatus Nomurabacteria bacterium]USN87404.1 MAG: hypothetical protein H6779_03235 [Candidatus Nomurabacteria bacterium]
METANILDRKLAAIETSQTDTDCFKHIHGYIKYILETPELKAILDTEEKDFYRKVKFTDDNIKLEQANYYQAYFVASYVRIYLPIEHYWNSNEQDEKQDPVALLLIWGPKHPRTMKWVNGHDFFSKREQLKQLKSYWQWFDGQRDFYISEIKNLHLALITELSKQKALPTVADEKPDVFQMNLETGDFNLGGVTGTLNITTQEFRVMAKLYTAPNHRMPYLDSKNIPHLSRWGYFDTIVGNVTNYKKVTQC